MTSDPFCTDVVKVLILVVVGEVVVIGGDGGDDDGGGDNAQRYRDWDFQLITFKGHDYEADPERTN